MIEDNTLAYKKAAKIYADIIKDKKIKKVEWPANFSDLYSTENIWDQEKNFLVLNQNLYKII